MTDADAIRSQVRDWVDCVWDPDIALIEWRRKLLSSGWAAPSWPERWGGKGLPTWADEVARTAVVEAGAVGPPRGSGTTLAAPTILKHGPDSVRDRFLGPTITGEIAWCQLFSEPGAGSDLAGLTTTARFVDDEWLVNGQKVWTTSAHHADFGMLVARTDWGAPKHKGLTYFAIPMRQPGVEVRPLRQMNCHSSFNEVFLTDARVPRDNVIGSVGDGWNVALTTLDFERRFTILSRPRYAKSSGRTLEEARQEARDLFEPYRWYPQRMGRVDLALERAALRGKALDPVIRDELARLVTMARVSQWTSERAREAAHLGRSSGPAGSIGKLAASRIARQAAKVHSMMSGAEAMLACADDPLVAVIAEILISVPAQSIAGGTDEIQHNILAEKLLGLPRADPGEQDQPFRELPRN